MTRIAAAYDETATRLLVQEAGNVGTSMQRAAATERVYRKLVTQFSSLIGEEGVGALFVRSIKLAAAESASFARVYAAASTSRLAGAEPPELEFVRCLGELAVTEVTVEATRFVSSFLALTANFIGDALVSRVVRGAFGSTDDGKSKEMADE